MLSLAEMSEALTALLQKNRAFGFELYAALSGEGLGQPAQIKSQENVWGKYGYLFVKSGCLKLFRENKLVRFYSDGDFVDCESVEGYRLISEFSSDVVAFDKDELWKALRENQEHSRLWTARSELEAQVLRSLCATYAPEHKERDFEFKRYAPGDVILDAGIEPNEVFILVDGEAGVFLGDARVGTVHEGEMLGEVSFLAECKTTAKVVSQTHCTVQAVDREEFSDLIRTNPHMVIKVAQTLAKRIAQTNSAYPNEK